MRSLRRWLRRHALESSRRWVITHGARSSRDLFLTFDDGPDPDNTPAVLGVLARHAVKATFFMVGRELALHPETGRMVADGGHELGNHTVSHLYMSRLSNRARALEIDAMHAQLRAIDGREQRLFRPPYGAVSAGLVWFCIRRGHRIALWSRDSLDFRSSVAEVVGDFAQTPVSAGDVLLFHDDSRAAAGALQELIPMWLAQGYRFRTLGDMR